MGISNLSFSATNINVGLDADKSANPREGDLYLATDTKILYRCYDNDTWTSDDIDTVKPNIARLNSGEFTGNGATNRAIAHDTGVKPVCVLCFRSEAGGILIGDTAWITMYTPDHVSTQSTTAKDVTNFYVSGYMNTNGLVYSWVVLY